MSYISLTTAICRPAIRSSFRLPPLSVIKFRRAASLNSAIGRGLRKSKGVGFRGKERVEERSGNNTGFQRHDSPIRRTADPLPNSGGPKLRRESWREGTGKARGNEDGGASSNGPPARLRVGKRVLKSDQDPPPRRSRAARFHDPSYSFGKKAQSKKADTIPGASLSTSKQRALQSDRTALLRNPNGTKLSASRLAYLTRGTEEPSAKKDTSLPITQTTAKQGSRDVDDASHRGKVQGEPRRSNRTMPYIQDEQGYASGRRQNDRFQKQEEPSRFSRERDGSQYRHSATASGAGRESEGQAYVPKSNQSKDSHLPLSIPYTTPASEFLYGTSVVQAALSSHRVPRRKLYKLYIYTGENRDNADRDAGVERLARKIHVEVVHVGNEWLRLMDKMSAGRPHNGYILEASPLPKLPITSLGEFMSQAGDPGFKVTLDHQSREEQAVNGTSDFIPLPRDARGRKPFILFLDSILDPGNLGGIIRTASFLGVTAIAISTRNSATFTPVVLKASAGASENVTLFSINKPAGFIADSKLAGWKVYAAVAPTGQRSSKNSSQITTDNLKDPLVQDPCILMLGNEGEGLRWNLRSKADVELAIQGSAQRGGVDSLNVSVATGILCNAFLSSRGRAEQPAPAPVFERSEVRKALF